MARITILFGILLVVLGAAVYAGIHATEPHAVTSLIPAFFGVVLVLLGFAADTTDTRRRMLFMHIAVTVGLIGFLLPFARSIRNAIRMANGQFVLHPLAVKESMGMAAICLVYVLLCVRSFVGARMSRAL